MTEKISIETLENGKTVGMSDEPHGDSGASADSLEWVKQYADKWLPKGYVYLAIVGKKHFPMAKKMETNFTGWLYQKDLVDTVSHAEVFKVMESEGSGKHLNFSKDKVFGHYSLNAPRHIMIHDANNTLPAGTKYLLTHAKDGSVASWIYLKELEQWLVDHELKNSEKISFEVCVSGSR